TPSYPIHTYAPFFAGASVLKAPVAGGVDAIEDAIRSSRERPRAVVLSYPHNPTTACADLELFERAVALAREHELLLVHDFAYADVAFDGHEPPSILQVPGADEVAVELYTMTKGFSMAGWRVGFLVGNADVVAALTRLKSYLDYGTFQPIQIAATVALVENEHRIRQAVRGLRRALPALAGSAVG